jgi:hypothetical protein
MRLAQVLQLACGANFFKVQLETEVGRCKMHHSIGILRTGCCRRFYSSVADLTDNLELSDDAEEEKDEDEEEVEVEDSKQELSDDENTVTFSKNSPRVSFVTSGSLPLDSLLIGHRSFEVYNVEECFGEHSSRPRLCPSTAFCQPQAAVDIFDVHRQDVCEFSLSYVIRRTFCCCCF